MLVRTRLACPHAAHCRRHSCRIHSPMTLRSSRIVPGTPPSLVRFARRDCALISGLLDLDADQRPGAGGDEQRRRLAERHPHHGAGRVVRGRSDDLRRHPASRPDVRRPARRHRCRASPPRAACRAGTPSRPSRSRGPVAGGHVEHAVVEAAVYSVTSLPRQQVVEHVGDHQQALGPRQALRVLLRRRRQREDGVDRMIWTPVASYSCSGPTGAMARCIAADVAGVAVAGGRVDQPAVGVEQPVVDAPGVDPDRARRGPRPRRGRPGRR